MKTKRILLIAAILMVIAASVPAQSLQELTGQRPVRIITDTNFLKNVLHIHYLSDTCRTLKTIIWHDTVYILNLYSEVQLPEKGFPAVNIHEWKKDKAVCIWPSQFAMLNETQPLWRRKPWNMG